MYATSSVAVNTAELVKLGASLISVTVTVYVTAVAEFNPSVTVMV